MHRFGARRVTGMARAGADAGTVGAAVTRRGALLRAGAAAGAATLLGPAAARAALPAPAPVGDDVAYLQFATIAERVALNYYRRAGDRPRARQKAAQVAKLTTALGADAPSHDDFTIALPSKAFATPRTTAALGARIETLLVRALLGALAAVTDGSSRLLLARLLANDAQHLAALRAAAGLPAAQ